MSYKPLFSPHAAKAYRETQRDLRERFDKAIQEICRSPHHGPQTKQLKGILKEYRRYRVGDYRILYAVSKIRHEVYIDYIQHRKEAYRL